MYYVILIRSLQMIPLLKEYSEMVIPTQALKANFLK